MGAEPVSDLIGEGAARSQTGVRLDTVFVDLARIRQDLVHWVRAQEQPPMHLADALEPMAEAGFSDGAPSELDKTSLEALFVRTLGISGGEVKLLNVLRNMPRPAALNSVKAALDLLDFESRPLAGTEPRPLSIPQASAQTAPSVGEAAHAVRPGVEGSAPISGSGDVTSRLPAAERPDSGKAFAATFLRLVARTLEEPTLSALPRITHESGLPMSGQARLIDKEWLGDWDAESRADPAAAGLGRDRMRLRLFDGSRSFTLLAPEAPGLGMPVTYAFSQAQGLLGHVSSQGRVQDGASSGSPASLADRPDAAPSRPTWTLSPVLESAYGLASAEGRLALAVAQDALAEIADAPYADRAVCDFARVLEVSGLLRSAAAPMNPEPVNPEHVASLLEYWLKSPQPDTAHRLPTLPGFAQALRDPATRLAALHGLRPLIATEGETPMPLPLGPQTLLVPSDAAGLAKRLQASDPTLAESMARGLTLEQWARFETENPDAAGAAAHGPGHAHLTGALQALAQALRPDAGPSQEGLMLFYLANPPQWVEARAEPDLGRQARSEKRGRRAGSGWQAHVDWTGDFLGQAVACVKWLADEAGDRSDSAGAHPRHGIDLVVDHFGPQALHAMQAQIPRLEAALATQGLALQGWRYQHHAEGPGPHAAAPGRPDASREAPGLPGSKPLPQIDLRF